MKKYTKLICLAIILTFSAISITGCNTMQGLGQDIKATGSALEDAADND